MEILSAKQMYQADSETIKHGSSSQQLMQRAGAAVVEAIRNHFSRRNVLVICGPGNNGGDGFLIAGMLAEEGWHVNVALYGDARNLNADVAKAAQEWQGKVYMLDKRLLEGVDLVVDALFGVGLNRPIEGTAADVIHEINARRLDVVSVDIPSGVDGDSGQVLGVAVRAMLTVTFARKKIGHVLYPGRSYCGDLIVADIGIKGEFIHSGLIENEPALWLEHFPFPEEDQHKYMRGHVVILGGGIRCTGAASLASLAALRAGSGLVTVAAPENAVLVYAIKLTSVMSKTVDTVEDFAAFIADPRHNVVLMGPGNGVSDHTRNCVLEALAQKKACVLDADALTVFEGKADALFSAIHSPVVLTPHEGEFARIFSFKGSKIEKTVKAAKQSGAVVVLKGADTVIACPNGRVVVNTNAPAWLATAGSGDVLAGIIAGLLANKMDAFDAACAGVWLHSEAAQKAGMGMISEILPEFLPKVMQDLYRWV